MNVYAHVVCAASLACVASCVGPAFDDIFPDFEGPGGENGTEGFGAAPPPIEVLDVLFVLDSSAGMVEEHERLIDAVAADGLLELLLDSDIDFRIGVITADVGACDNRIPEAMGGAAWGFRPQRGCLHGDGPPDTSPRKVIASADLEDDDETNDDLGARFRSTIENVGTFGSPFVRPFDALEIFLDDTALERRSEGCESDFFLFRRPIAEFVPIIVTSQEDCSHRDGARGFVDENEGEVCGEFPAPHTEHDPSACTADTDALGSVSSYVTSIPDRAPTTRSIVLGGFVGNEETRGCVDAVGSACFSSGGRSHLTAPGEPCAEDTADARGGLPCCQADAMPRVQSLWGGLGGGGGAVRRESYASDLCGNLSVVEVAL